ncbi:branched-chain amino acid ABC transporter permease [Stappia sp. F7233]|uniref:Branched-chain amino acid ABC transporter permease n=1 Tax=Stappia albiluteola TaxID=2758565 RepID=A0A839AA27_9HYPH|nr:branched-chain amino acid ABC transporter permease [Stappia albiluteola]MBA5776413.1 branched-chain amino acid ABC transporter permease [Stappia albiluteola]
MENATASLFRARLVPGLILAAFGLLPVLAGLIDDTFIVFFAIRVMIFAIAAVSLALILGFGAMVSFGHAAYIGLGAYTVGILAENGVWEFYVSLPATLVVCGLFALVTGAISLKTRGVYFIMITLAFGQMAYYTATSLSAYGGDDGLTMWGRTEIFGSSMLSDRMTFYYVVFAVLVAVWWLCRTMVNSRFGRVLQGARQSEMRLQAIGIDPYAYRLAAYVIAGMIAGVAGALLANAAEFVSPAYMSWHRSGELIFMVVLGGLGSFSGAILGASGYLVLEEVLSHVTENWRLIFGPFLILVVLYGRGGLLGLITGGKRDG